MVLYFRWRSSGPKWLQQRECSEPAGQDGDLPHPNQQVWATWRRWQRLKDSNDKVSLLLENVKKCTVWEFINLNSGHAATLNHTYSEVLNIDFGIAMNAMWCTFLIPHTVCVSLWLSLSSMSLLPFLLFYRFLSKKEGVWWAVLSCLWTCIRLHQFLTGNCSGELVASLFFGVYKV